MRMIVFEDVAVIKLGPLAQTRPVFDLRCGAGSLFDRQQRCLVADEIGFLVRPELANLARCLWPSRAINDPNWTNRVPVVLVNGRWLAPPSIPLDLETAHLGTIGDQIAYIVLPQGVEDLTAQNLSWFLEDCRKKLPAHKAEGVMINYPWDLVENNSKSLLDDERYWTTHCPSASFEGVSVIGDAARFLADPSAQVEPLTLIDTRKGPVILDRDVVVQAFSRLEGPCYVGPGTHIFAAKVKGASFGPQCRIGGEVESSIVHGHSNKAHDGFLGHSYVGEWVNLGAGTHTSDLRNDYGNVTISIAGQKVQTGLIKVGSFLGDHTKTSIDTLFNTGSVIGPFSMLVASGGLLPRHLPAFSMYADGKLHERTDLGTTFSTAQVMMSRRGVSWSEDHADFFLELYEQTSGERQKLMHDTEQRRVRRVV